MSTNESLSTLADVINGAFLDPRKAEQHLAVYRNELNRLAAKEVSNGTKTVEEISIMEDQDADALLPQLFWATRSLMHSQVMSLAASRIAHWK